MRFNQKSEPEDSVQKFYFLIYKKFNQLIKEYIDNNPQSVINEDLNGDDFISVFDKYFINFVENGKFFVEVKIRTEWKIIIEAVPYLELHIENEENFVFVNNNIRKVKDNFNRVPFENCKKLAEEMGYDYIRNASENKNNNKTSKKGGFYVPYSDFERGILICAFEKLNRRVIYLEKEIDVLEKETEGLEKEISYKTNVIKKLKDDKMGYEKASNDLKDFKDQNRILLKEISKLKSDNLIYKITVDEANKKLAEDKKLINALILKIKKDSNKRE